MADMTTTAEAAHLSDAMQNGFRAAMLRAEAYDATGNRTLVDEMAVNGWANWDASNECPIVSDLDGIDEPTLVREAA